MPCVFQPSRLGVTLQIHNPVSISFPRRRQRAARVFATSQVDSTPWDLTSGGSWRSAFSGSAQRRPSRELVSRKHRIQPAASWKGSAVVPRSQDEDLSATETAEHVQSAGSAGASGSATTHGEDGPADSREAALRQADVASASGRGFNSMLGRRSQEKQAEQSVADKLIAVFASKSPAEWRKLIAFSKQWPTLADSVLERLDEQIAAEGNLSDKSKLKKLARRLRSVHGELKEYSELLQSFREKGMHEWESIVATNRPSFTSEFFQHAENLIKAAQNCPEEQEVLAETVTKILALVTAFDEVSANQEAMEDAALQFDGLLQVGSLEEADGKIDELAAAGKLDPALLLTMAKAYAAAKETDKTQEEVKDIMAHLYFKAKESFAKMQPPEVRILKQLLSLDDPRQRSDELAAAFQPGPELETNTHDFLSTTPAKLLAAMDLILDTYERSAGSAGMLGQAGALMNPEVIQRLREIQAIVRKDYT